MIGDQRPHLTLVNHVCAGCEVESKASSIHTSIKTSPPNVLPSDLERRIYTSRLAVSCSVVQFLVE